MSGPVTLIAVIGPVEPALLSAWCAHYRDLGVDHFAIALHCPDTASTTLRDELAATLRAATGVDPALLAGGGWHEHTNSILRDQLRARARKGWHLLADADEFQHHPDGLRASIRTAQDSGQAVLGGLLLDRVAADGGFCLWTPAVGLDRSYPLGGLLTHELLRGDPRKIVLAHSSVAVTSGNHRAPGHRPPADAVVPIHHFKWRAGIVADLQRRVESFTTGVWRETSPAVRCEAQRLLDHISQHGGGLDVTGAAVAFRPVCLTALPTWWPAQASAVVQAWRPPSPEGQIRPAAPMTTTDAAPERSILPRLHTQLNILITASHRLARLLRGTPGP
ncbi:MAG: glycosyltransferase family 2 protein [Pseudonocardiales bacterium]|nr:glycosyltransferase family 2 protein [Pseudonocardiales bacterium]